MDMETFWKRLLLGQKHFWRKMGIERINSNLKSDGLISCGIHLTPYPTAWIWWKILKN